jgi:hypothetical protein
VAFQLAGDEVPIFQLRGQAVPYDGVQVASEDLRVLGAVAAA